MKRNKARRVVLAAIVVAAASAPIPGSLRAGPTAHGPFASGLSPVSASSLRLTGRPAYDLDSDGDGVVDALDACPTDPAIKTGKPSARADCYLGMKWVRDTLPNETPNCILAMAFPVADKTWDRTEPHRGVVLIGSSLDYDRVKVAAQAGSPWPSDATSTCLVSIDYETFNGTRAFASATTLSAVYLKYEAGDFGGAIQPATGMGVIVDDIQTVKTRNPKTPELQRLPFSRGVLYGRSLVDEPTQGCVIDTSVSTSRCDPTKGAGSGLCVTRVPHVTCTPTFYVMPKDAIAPPDWRYVPRALDAALRRDHAQARAAGGAGAAPIFDSIEDVPQLFYDDRWPDALPLSIQVGSTIGIPLKTGGLLFSPVSLLDRAAEPWLLVPAAVARLGRHRRDFSLGQRPFRPSGPAGYSPASGGHSLVQQNFVVDSYGKSETFTRSVETTWPVVAPTAAVSEANPRQGYRWSTNDEPHCWYTWSYQRTAATTLPFNDSAADADFFADWTINSAGGSAGVLATPFCPNKLFQWWSTTREAKNANAAVTACLPFTRGTSVFKADTELSIVNGAYEGICGGAHVVINIAKDAYECSLCIVTAGLFGDCDACLPTSEVRDTVGQCVIAAAFSSSHDNMITKEHWVDLSNERQLVAMTSYLRPRPAADDPAAMAAWSERSMNSNQTPQDMFINHAHQGTDWNWIVESPLAIDPHDLLIAIRLDDSNHYQFNGIENELELNVPMGEWTAELSDHDGSKPDLHGYSERDYVWDFGALSLDQEWLGQIWPAQFCDMYGIDRSMIDATHRNNPSIPVGNCGTDGYTLSPAHWRHHFGRGIFSPYQAETMPPFEQSRMAVSKGWRPSQGEPKTVPLGFPDPTAWGSLPHRMSFLGQPIADCGHDPFRVEIHPPHVVTLDLAAVDNGLVYAGFGWVNPSIDGNLEFDLWPPPRPSASARFAALGQDSQLADVASGFGSDFGYVIDNSGPSHVLTAPTLACVSAPTEFPNHLHCKYTDLAGNKTIYSDDDQAHDNPRMLPKYASSRFDIRFWVGWK